MKTQLSNPKHCIYTYAAYRMYTFINKDNIVAVVYPQVLMIAGSSCSLGFEDCTKTVLKHVWIEKCQKKLMGAYVQSGGFIVQDDGRCWCQALITLGDCQRYDNINSGIRTQ